MKKPLLQAYSLKTKLCTLDDMVLTVFALAIMQVRI